jgi:putative ABC transport system ATP-binding protein
MSPLLTADDLHKSFGPVPALRGASIAVAKGEVVAVMGPSGSGKSTLLHCLAGLLRPDSGEVRYGGRRIDVLPDRERARLRRSTFGFVFQFGQLVPELTVRENIAMPLLLAGQRRRVAFAAVEPWLARLGLEGLGDRLPGDLSGGQGQRAAVGRALIAGPEMVFADEPTGSLDSVASDEVMDLLVDVARREGTSVLVVTHEPRVAACADRTVLVRDGADTLRSAFGPPGVGPDVAGGAGATAGAGVP